MTVKMEEKAEVLKALGHPARLAIVVGLCKHECNVTKMVKALGIPQSTVSQHLGVLKSAGVIKGERRGLEVCYRIMIPWVKELIKQ